MKNIAIHSVPRSGSTWLGSIFDSHPSVVYKLQPLFSYALKGRLTEHSNKKEINDFFSDLARIDDDFLDQKIGKKNGIIPEFEKSEPNTIVYKEVRYHYIIKNLLERDSSLKVVGIIRNPLSVVSSWLKAPKEFRKDLGWKIKEEWRFAAKKNLKKNEEFNGYEKWKEVVFIFLDLKNRFPERFYLINYDHLIADPEKEVRNLFKFCELRMTEQTLNFLRLSSSSNHLDSYSVYKEKKQDDLWKEELPPFIVEEIKKDPDFVKLNLTFQWI